MSKKAKYVSVTDVKKTSRNALVQGTLISCETQQACSLKKNFDETFETNSPVLKNKVKHPKVVCHNASVAQSQLSTSSKPEKIIADVPTSLTFSSSSVLPSESNSSDSKLYNSNCSHRKHPIGNNHIVKLGQRNSVNRTSTDGQRNKPGGDCLQLTGIENAAKKNLSSKSDVNMKNNETSKAVGKKKKAIKVVASRYMTSHQPSLTKTKVQSVSKVTEPKVNKPAKLYSNSSKPKPEKVCAPIEKASTPTSKFKSFFESDMSVIQSAPNSKLKINKLDSRFISVQYARYLRCLYLQASMQKASLNRRKAAFNDLNKLVDAEVKLQQEVSTLENEVNSLENEKNLNFILDEQSNTLGPVTNKLEVTCEKYQKLAENIDAVRHGLPVTEAAISSEDALEASLMEMDNVLKDLTLLTQNHANSSLVGSTNADHLKSTVCGEGSAFECANKDLKAMNDLSNKKINLQLQMESEKMFL